MIKRRKRRGLDCDARSLAKALWDRGEIDFKSGITECPFTVEKMALEWQAGWDAAQQAMKEGNRT